MKIKQLTLALMALGLSGAAVAGSFTPPAEPAPQPKWIVGGHAIYGETGHDDSVFALSATAPNPTQTVAKRHDTWGFRVWLGYDTGENTSYALDWTRIHNHGETTSTPAGVGVTPTRDGAAANRTSVTGRQAADFDQVTLQMAHTFKNKNGTNVRVHAGAQYLELNDTLTLGGLQLAAQVNATDTSKFCGGGILAGVDLEHMFGNEFSIFSRNQVGLVYGERKTAFNQTAGAPLAAMSMGHKHSVLPTVNAELGAAYSMEMASVGDVRFEAGVRGTAVVDGVQHYDPFGAAAPNSAERSTFTEASLFFGAQVAFSGGMFA